MRNTPPPLASARACLLFCILFALLGLVVIAIGVIRFVQARSPDLYYMDIAVIAPILAGLVSFYMAMKFGRGAIQARRLER
jgi:hypothetical protein